MVAAAQTAKFAVGATLAAFEEMTAVFDLPVTESAEESAVLAERAAVGPAEKSL